METAKSLITFAVEVGLVVAAYFMGYNGGQVSVLEKFIEQTKEIETGLLGIINDMYERLNKAYGHDEEN